MVATSVPHRAFSQNSFWHLPLNLNHCFAWFRQTYRAISFKSSQSMMHCDAGIAFGNGLGGGEMPEVG